MKEVITDLCDRMALLHNRYDVVFRMTGPGPHRPYIPLADFLLAGLRGEAPSAVSIARALVDPADLDVPEFWATPLGQEMFAAGCYQDEAVTQSCAAGVLGVSRQRIHQMVGSGAIRSESGVNPAARMVHAGDVRDLLKAKIDTPVK